MEFADLLQAGALVLIAFVTATAALLAALVVTGQNGVPVPPAEGPEVAFLFDGDRLVDATQAGHRLLNYAGNRGNDMARLVAFLSPRFPELHARVGACGEEDSIVLLSSDCRSRLRLRSSAGKLRLSLEEVDPDSAELPDRHSLAILATELEAHRSALRAASVPVWRLGDNGHVTWANGAYWSLADRAGLTGELRPGEVPRLFDDLSIATMDSGARQRAQVQVLGDSRPRWFDVAGCTLRDERILAALPADGAVTAERNLREFIQTLTQTFAHLSVGLAIFDRKRELTLFNPALGDLLGLEVDFLVARPSLIRFLDRLRERQMMPEPKDYKTWRQDMSELEAAAAGSGHAETWPLADGRTFRITGRPHPDGAIALMFEDISAEISLSREYQEELETGQAVIDTLDEAIAVFSADGRLSFANQAYAKLWSDDGAAVVTRRANDSFMEASRLWQQNCMPTPVWGDARDFASEMTGRTTWHADARLRDGRRLSCRFEPLPGGGTMAGFSILGMNGFQPASAGVTDPIGSSTARA